MKITIISKEYVYFSLATLLVQNNKMLAAEYGIKKYFIFWQIRIQT